MTSSNEPAPHRGTQRIKSQIGTVGHGKKLLISAPRDEHIGPTPRNASGKSAGLMSSVTGNITTTSAAVNQSFQFGYNTQINQTVVSATS